MKTALNRILKSYDAKIMNIIFNELQVYAKTSNS